MAKSRSLAQAKRAQQGRAKKQQQAKALGGNKPPVSSALKAYRLARLDTLLAKAEAPLREAFAQGAGRLPAVLFLSFTDGMARARVMHATGATPDAAWQALGQQLARETLAGAKVRFVRLEWVESVRSASWQQAEQLMTRTKRNYFRYGIALDADFRYPLLEQEINANAVLYAGHQVEHARLNPGNYRVYTRARFGKAQPVPEPAQQVGLFTTRGFFMQAGEEPVAINGHTDGVAGRDVGRRAVAPLDAPEVTGLITQSSRFLAEQVNGRGHFVYGIHPCFDRDINTYNTLRHTSTTYAMLEAWEIPREPALKQAIERSIGYLTGELIRDYTAPGGERLAYLTDQNNEIKLGGNAVSLLALVKYTELTGDERHLPLMEGLALGIRHMQDPRTGQMVHVLNADDLSVKEAFRIIYYDGEAAFGLMRLYGLTGDERWLETVVTAFDYFIEQKHWQVHDHWLSYCVNELTQYRPEERYFRFGIQNVAGYLDFVIERITTFPTLLELMMAAHKMLLRLEQSDQHRHLLRQIDKDKFYRALETRARHLLNGFFWPEVAMFFKNPQRILGSFFIRHHGFRVRIDDVEHYLSGFVAYLQHYLPEPYRSSERPRAASPAAGEGTPAPVSAPASEAESASGQGWNAWHLSQATPGEWATPPAEGWQATGLSFTRLSFQPGHMVVLKSPNSRRGMPLERLSALPAPPSAVVFQGDEPALTEQGAEQGIPGYRVASVDEAILDIGRYARSRFSGRVVGVTGSAGKTSSVALLQSLLGHWGETGASRLSGNLPHGIAWNLASMDWQASFQVVEMAIGRMALNSSLARPDVAVFLNVGPAHLEFHQSTDQVAIRKSHIFDAMAPGSHAVINRDMEEWPLVVEPARQKNLQVITFGTHADSDIRWLNPTALTSDAGAEVAIGEHRLTLPLYQQGSHVVMNVLAALGTMLALDLPYAEVVPALAAMEKVAGRGQQWEQPYLGGSVTLLDDAYNANPLSMQALLSQLAVRQPAGSKHLILGDMLELGEGSGEHHRALVADILAAGVSSLTLVGEQMQALAPQLKGGVSHIVCADDHDQARRFLLPLLAPGDLVVAKGSNKFKLSGLLKNLVKLSYVVLDEAGSEVISAQSALPFRPGSLVKLVTAMLVLDHIQDLSRTFTVEAEDMVGGSGANLKVGDTLTVEDALHNLLIPSSNRAAQGLARMVGRQLLHKRQPDDQAMSCFIHAMNDKARALGASATRLATASGLHHREMYSTASDMARISRAAFEYPLIARILAKHSHTLAITGSQPRRLTVKTRMETLELPGSISVAGGKTGTLVGTAENLMVKAVINGKPVLAVLMQQGGSRWNLMSGLLQEALTACETERVKA